jgi:hypothetical protein
LITERNTAARMAEDKLGATTETINDTKNKLIAAQQRYHHTCPHAHLYTNNIVGAHSEEKLNALLVEARHQTEIAVSITFFTTCLASTTS